MEMPCCGKPDRVEILYRQVAGCRAFTEILHNGIGSIGHFRFKLKARWITAIQCHACGLDPLFFQGVEHKLAEAVIADAAHPAHLQAETRQAGGDVEFCTGDALHKLIDGAKFAGFRGDKHGHGFADGDDIQSMRHGVTPRAVN